MLLVTQFIVKFIKESKVEFNQIATFSVFIPHITPLVLPFWTRMDVYLFTTDERDAIE